MSNHNTHHMMHALKHQIDREKAKGNTSGANALALIGLGIVLLPVPFIGLPLLIWGIVKSCSSSPDGGKTDSDKS